MDAKKLQHIARVIEKIAITYREYRKLHPKTKLKPTDRLFVHNMNKHPKPKLPMKANRKRRKPKLEKPINSLGGKWRHLNKPFETIKP